MSGLSASCVCSTGTGDEAGPSLAQATLLCGLWLWRHPGQLLQLRHRRHVSGAAHTLLADSKALRVM